MVRQPDHASPAESEETILARYFVSGPSAGPWRDGTLALVFDPPSFAVTRPSEAAPIGADRSIQISGTSH